jgi:hypothetical protein
MTYYYKTAKGAIQTISKMDLSPLTELEYNLIINPNYIPPYKDTFESNELFNEYTRKLMNDAYQDASLIDNTPQDISPDLFGYNSWQELHQDHNVNQVERYQQLCKRLGLIPKDDLTLKDINDYLEMICL